MNSLKIRAFNLTKGAAIVRTTQDSWTDRPQSEVWVIIDVIRDIDNERVYAWARRADEIREGSGDVQDFGAMDFDFNETIEVVGAVVNERDIDDNDFGN